MTYQAQDMSLSTVHITAVGKGLILHGMSPPAKSIDRNYPAKASQPTFDVIEQASIVYLELTLVVE